MGGEKKKRILEFGDKANYIKEFLVQYQYSLRALISSLPEHYDIKLPVEIVTVGNSEVWPCQDGAVVLLYSSPTSDINVDIKAPLNRTINEFLQHGKALAFYDENGNRLKGQPSLQINMEEVPVIYFAKLSIKMGSKKYYTRYQKGLLFGWNAELPIPDELALEDFRSVFITRNVGGVDAIELPIQESQRLTTENAEKLILEFDQLLNTAEREEDIQIFLTQNPQFIYPEFVEYYPKFKLGEEFITDYVFLIQGLEGPEYIFVEIEQVGKKIFTGQNRFTSDLTQAKDQLLNWENWITHNHSYIARKLPGFFKPTYHLIMGRSKDLTDGHREKLKVEYGSKSWIFSTYDDLLNRFHQITDHIRQSN